MKKTILAAACAAFLAGPVLAQTAAPTTPAKPPMTAPAAQPAKPSMAAPGAEKPARTAKSMDCSKQADAQGLHGKKRKTFRDACKKG
jgi:hypothetical protein